MGSKRERERNRVFRSFAHGSLLSTVNYTCKIKILAAIATEKTGKLQRKQLMDRATTFYGEKSLKFLHVG